MKSLLEILKTTYKKRLPGEKETLAKNAGVSFFPVHISKKLRYFLFRADA